MNQRAALNDPASAARELVGLASIAPTGRRSVSTAGVEPASGVPRD